MENKKITINMLSKADSVEGQGVGSAYIEQVRLVKESDLFEVSVNNKPKRKGKYDITHVHSVNPEYVFKIKKGKVRVIYVHFLPETLDGSIKLNKFFLWIFKKYIIRLYKMGDHLVVVNPAFIKLLQNYNIQESKVTYIPNYVDTKTVFKLPDGEILSIKEKYGIDKDKFVVIGVGQVQTRKGVREFCQIAEQMPHIQFIWCGGFSFKSMTDGYKDLKKLMDNPPANVKFLGIIPRNDMNEIYNIANLLFLPSYSELFPMTILEAIQIDLPLLVRDLDLYSPILFDHCRKAENNDCFAREIEVLNSSNDEYKKAQEDSAWLRKKYSKESILKQREDFYTTIYNKRKRK